MLEWGRERVRVGRWRGGSGIALLSPASDGPLPSASFLSHCLERLAAQGYTSVVTAALTEPEQTPFLAAGFGEQERLRLLIHDMREVPPVPDARLRRAVEGDRQKVLAVDAASFSPFWQLDDWSLQDAIEATPAARFRVALDRRDALVGYAVSGRTQRRGYLQRLAVHPAARGHGLGAALVLDGLRWMRRRSVERAVVNTQLENEAARRLYLRLGFREQPPGLAVLRYDLAP
ncbi:MAG: GNAT family N-acetyltransferase [Gaiellaceae bacterium]